MKTSNLKWAHTFGAVLLSLVPGYSVGALLSSVPMQGGMVMPVVSYHAPEGKIHVAMPDTVPQLTPLLVSHPADWFNPGDPWFDALDPSAQGLAFSRRYGFVMDANTDILPDGIQMWIRRISGSDALLAYRYRDSEPKAMQPIFGTAGTTNAMSWSGMMFHPLFAGASGTNSFQAVFEVYLLDTGTGQELRDSGSGPLLFQWTSIPDGRPQLTMRSTSVLAWPASATNWSLQGAETLLPSAWTPITNAPTITNDEARVLLDPADPRTFFRLELSR